MKRRRPRCSVDGCYVVSSVGSRRCWRHGGGKKVERAAQATPRASFVAPGKCPTCGQHLASVDIPIRSLPLSTRAFNVAINYGDRLGALACHSAIEVLQSKNCGVATLRELQSILRACGLSFRSE